MKRLLSPKFAKERNTLRLDRLRLVPKARHHNGAPVRLPADIWHLILGEHAHNSSDILSVALAHGSGYKHFVRYLYQYNVRYGGCSVLEWAATKGDLEVAKRMLQVPEMEGFVPEETWCTVLNIAQKKNSIELARLLFAKQTVQTLLEAAANKFKESEWRHLDESWLQPMFNAAKDGQVDLIKLYLCHVSVDLRYVNGSTLLNHAVESGRFDVAKSLLEEHEADPNTISSHGLRPIEQAAEAGHLELVELLLSHGVDPSHPGESTMSPAFLLAVRKGHREVVKLFLRDDRIDPNKRSNLNLPGLYSDGTPLELAAEEGRDEVVRLLLDDVRVDLNSRDRHENTPLLIASRAYYFRILTLNGTPQENEIAERRQQNIIGMLLQDERVDVSARDNRGRNACCLAAMYGRYSFTKMILDDGRIDPNESDKFGMTSFMHAASSRCTKTFELLMEDERVNLEKRSNSGQTALLLAARSRQEKNFEKLLSLGRYNPDQAGDNGMTPLMYACSNMLLPVVKLLLDTGSVDLNKRDEKGWTPLMHAIRPAITVDRVVEAIVKMLLDRGHGLINHQYLNGLSIAEYAAKYYHANILEMFLETGEISVKPFVYTKRPSVRGVVVRYLEKRLKDEEKQMNYEEKQMIDNMLAVVAYNAALEPWDYSYVLY